MPDETTLETPATLTTESEPVAADPTISSTIWSAESSSFPDTSCAAEETTAASNEQNLPSPSEAAPYPSAIPATVPEPTPAAAEEPSETGTPSAADLDAVAAEQSIAASTSTTAVVEQVSEATETAVAEAKAAISTLLVHGETLFTAAKDELDHAREVLSILQTSSAAGYPGTIVANVIEKLVAHVAGLEAAVNDFKAKTGKN